MRLGDLNMGNLGSRLGVRTVRYLEAESVVGSRSRFNVGHVPDLVED